MDLDDTPYEEMSIERCGRELVSLGEELMDAGRIRTLSIVTYEISCVQERLAEFDQME